MLTVLIILYLLGIAYACLEGIKEAWLFYYKYPNTFHKDGKDLHPLFVFQRGIVLLVIVVPSLLVFNIWTVVFLSMAFILYFPFFHDGSLYVKWDNLNGSKPKRWKDGSARPTPLEFNYSERCWMFVCSIACFTASILITLLSV